MKHPDDSGQPHERPHPISTSTSTVIEVLTRHHLDVMFGLATLFWFGAAFAIYAIEADQNPDIDNFADALWWSLITMSTVGYGEVVPVTLAGRVVAAGLIMGGLAMLGVIIANISALVISEDTIEEVDVVTAQLDEVLERLDRLEQKLDEASVPPPQSGNQSEQAR